jgi:uncharacterized membrane protein YidH (DUF202 family)
MTSKINNICPQNISDNEEIINCTEVMIKKQLLNLKDYHFPNRKTKNNFLVSLISIFHSLSIIYIFAGLFLNPKYLIFYSIYITFLLFSLLMHGNNCFLTILKGRISNYDKNPIHLQEKTSVLILCTLIILSLIGYVKPIFSLQNISRNILDFMYYSSNIICILSLGLFLLFFILYLIIVLKIYKKNKDKR